jgi:beta-glucosidase
VTTTSVPAHEKLPFRDPALPLAARVEDLLDRLTADERVAMLHQYAPAVPRLGLAAFRTGTEALHGVAWLGVATTFPQAVGLGATWDPDLVHEVATAVSVELRAFHHHRPPVVGSGTNSLQAWAPVVNLLRDPRWGRNEEGYSEDPLHTALLGDAFCRGMTGGDPEHLRTAPILKHFLAYNNEDERCTTSSGLRPRVLHEYDLAAFRTAIAGGSATGVMAAYNLVNGRPCHVSPLIESELRAWARPTGHELFVVSDAEAPSNLVDPEHYFDDHAASHAAALRAGIDSFTDHGEDCAVPVGRLREALRRGLIDDQDVARAVRRQLSLRFRLGEFDPARDPYAGIPWEVVDSPAHRALALRAATESVVLLKNDAGVLPLDPAAGRGRRLAVLGPLAATLFEDWYSGTMPYRITVADALADVLPERGGEVVVAEGVDRVALRSARTGALLAVPGDDPTGPLTAVAAAPAEGVRGGADRPGSVPDTAAFDVFDWGGGVLTLRNARTGRYLGLADADRSLDADRLLPGGWDVHETFRLEDLPDGTAVLRNEYSGHYAVTDPATGRVTVTAITPEQAEPWHLDVLRDGTAEAVAAARWADTALVVLGNDPHINGRETQDRAGTALPGAQEALLRAVAAARPRTAALLMSSYPYAVDWADAHLPAVLWTSHGGQETGRALAAVLLGDADPSGRLPQTWYRGDDRLPHPLDYDIIKAGWTYQYHRARPLYPFGHGLSYTEFRYASLRLTAGHVPQDGEVGVRLTLECAGPRPGTETVQLYVRALNARYQAPLLKLAGFRKVRLRPGERTEVDITVPASALAHWDVGTGAFTVDPGGYEVLAGRSARDIRCTARLRVTGPAPRPREVVGRWVAAADFDDYTDLRVVDASREKGDALAPAAARGSAEYRAVDLTGARAVRAEVAREEPGSGRLEFWRGAPGSAGALRLADLLVPCTGGRYTAVEVTAALPHAQSGTGDLHVVLTGEQRLAAFTLER